VAISDDFRRPRQPKPGETLELFKALLELNYFGAGVQLWADKLEVLMVSGAVRPGEAGCLPKLADWPDADELRQMFEYANTALQPAWVREEIATDAVRAITHNIGPENFDTAGRELLMALWDDPDGKLLAWAIREVRKADDEPPRFVPREGQ
jgi:hypothetical protein